MKEFVELRSDFEFSKTKVAQIGPSPYEPWKGPDSCSPSRAPAV